MADVDIPALKRRLEIQTGVTKRLTKEHNLYRKEAVQQQAKLDKLIAGNGEEWYIKNARNMLDEANKMIKDSDDRLSKSRLTLKDVITVAEKEAQLTGDEVLTKAQEALQEAEANV